MIIFSRDIEKHRHHADEILTSFDEAGVTLNLKKYRLFSGQFTTFAISSNPVD